MRREPSLSDTPFVSDALFDSDVSLISDTRPEQMRRAELRFVPAEESDTSVCVDWPPPPTLVDIEQANCQSVTLTTQLCDRLSIVQEPLVQALHWRPITWQSKRGGESWGFERSSRIIADLLDRAIVDSTQ